MGRYGAVGIGTRPRGSVAGNVETFFSTSKGPGGLCTNKSVAGAPSADVRRLGRKFDKWPQSNAEAKNERNYTSNPTHAVMA
jgi:hypothetical protein